MQLAEPDRTLFADVNRTRLRLWSWGDQSAPPVVLVHGAFDHGRMFDDLAPRVAAMGFHAVAVDMRGHGDSGPLWSGNTWLQMNLDLGIVTPTGKHVKLLTIAVNCEAQTTLKVVGTGQQHFGLIRHGCVDLAGGQQLEWARRIRGNLHVDVEAGSPEVPVGQRLVDPDVVGVGEPVEHHRERLGSSRRCGERVLLLAARGEADAQRGYGGEEDAVHQERFPLDS